MLINNNYSPTILLSLPNEEYRKIGVSGNKTKYIKDLSEKILMKDIGLTSLKYLENDEVIQQLTKVKGIGKWTAEMFLIFSLSRMNVLSLDDVGLQRGVKWLYGIKGENRGKEELKVRSLKWKPYYTIASLYLWEAVNKGYVIHFKNIDHAIVQLDEEGNAQYRKP